MKTFIPYIFVLILFACKTTPPPTPVIIRNPPVSEMNEDMSIEEYLYSSTKYRIEVEKYLDELINQIIHKVPYIDMRNERETGEKGPPEKEEKEEQKESEKNGTDQ